MKLKVLEFNSPEYSQSVELRRRVLRTPLGIDFTEAELQADATDLHLGIFSDENTIIAICILRRDSQLESRAKMRQVAVDPIVQKQGIGAALVRFFETEARKRSFTEITLNARETAVGFYERLGYRCHGERFTEVGLPHFQMTKQLHSES